MYNISLSIFYIFYALIEIPSNLVLRKVGARIWIPTIIVSFGIVTTLTSLIDNFGELMAVRVALGISEGGLMPAYLVVLARFYTRRELVLRTAIFASSAAIAGMFGGALVSCHSKLLFTSPEANHRFLRRHTASCRSAWPLSLPGKLSSSSRALSRLLAVFSPSLWFPTILQQPSSYRPKNE